MDSALVVLGFSHYGTNGTGRNGVAMAHMPGQHKHPMTG